MRQSIAGRFLGAAYHLADVLRLRKAIAGTIHRLPPRARLWVSRLQVRLGYMQGLLLVPERDLQRSFEAALRILDEDAGDPDGMYLEFGVFVGTSMACMYRAATRVGANNLRLVGFDSFQGMPEGVEHEDDHRWYRGQLYSDVRLTRRNLARLGVPPKRVELVSGWFAESLTDETRRRLGTTPAAVVMVDGGLLSTTRRALDFIAPLIRDRTIIYFDDWTVLHLADGRLVEPVAFEEWMTAHPELTASEVPSLSYNDDSRVYLVARVASQG